ncbi:hypothetical protein AB7783_26830 [Tardiphaga sp. 172_B4_N1_3]|uniref:hypothetical protein n=1 Tax=Tardiphaga sp. 172_B4_N1_3 TaxID=3240787 RepID=UPI003F8B1A1A
MTELRFQEELHAIQAAIDGQGIAICSNVLVQPELTQGSLRPISEITLPGYALYATFWASNPKKKSIEAFVEWVRVLARMNSRNRDILYDRSWRKGDNRAVERLPET